MTDLRSVTITWLDELNVVSLADARTLPPATLMYLRRCARWFYDPTGKCWRRAGETEHTWDSATRN